MIIKDHFLYLTITILICVFINYNLYSVSSTIDLENINSSSRFNIFNSIGYDLFDFVKNFEYIIEIDSKQIFPDQNIRNKVLETSKKIEYMIPSLRYDLLGFKIIAKNVKVITDSVHEYNGDKNKIRINFPVMHATNVNVKDKIIDLSFDNIDLSSTYIIYDSIKDIFSIHIPIHVALRYLP